MNNKTNKAMKFYQNKETGAIIGILDMCDLITSPTEKSISLGFEGYSRQTAYEVIHPNMCLGQGIKSFVITHKFLRENYKRINKKIAYAEYPDFVQYRHKHIPQLSTVERLEILGNQRW